MTGEGAYRICRGRAGCYHASVLLTPYGTRGSLPAPGARTALYGGNTSCVSVQAEGRLLVLDAGTGLSQLPLPDKLRRVDILLTHLHLDHIQGLGFFPALLRPEVQVHVWGPGAESSLRSRLARYLSPPLFPVQLGDLPARLHCHEVPAQPWELGPFRVQAHRITHPGPTLGFRVSAGGRSLAYLPDHEPQLGHSRLPRGELLSGFAIAEGVDLLLHDAQYTAEEYRERVGWGHCTAELAVRYAERVGAGGLLFFHHDPGRFDPELEALCAAAAATHQGAISIAPAAEGRIYRL